MGIAEATIKNSGMYKPLSVFLIISLRLTSLQWVNQRLGSPHTIPYSPPLIFFSHVFSGYLASHWSCLLVLIKNRFPGLFHRDSALVSGFSDSQPSAAGTSPRSHSHSCALFSFRFLHCLSNLAWKTWSPVSPVHLQKHNDTLFKWSVNKKLNAMGLISLCPCSWARL